MAAASCGNRAVSYTHLFIANGEGRIDSDGVAGVDAGALDVLHDAGDQDVLAVGNDVHFQFLAHEVLVHHCLLYTSFFMLVGVSTLASQVFRVVDYIEQPARHTRRHAAAR